MIGNVSLFPEPLAVDSTERIIEQMNNNKCRVYNNRNRTRCSAKIPYKSGLLPVLITINQVIKINDIKKNRNILIYHILLNFNFAFILNFTKNII